MVEGFRKTSSKCEYLGTYVGSLLKNKQTKKPTHHVFFTSYNGIKLIRENTENCIWVKCANEIISVFNLGSEI